MTVELIANSYGKSSVRLVRVTRNAQQHELKDVSVDIQFKGDFDTVYARGDNSKVLPTDTIKNTVYALAGHQPVGEIEEFGQRLSQHFFAGNPQISEIDIDIRERLWARIPVSGKPHPSAFVAGSNELRTATNVRAKNANSSQAGTDDLVLLLTTGSGFSGYIKDSYTTLPETNDRIFSTVVSAVWNYKNTATDFSRYWNEVRSTLLETFATHPSESVQHTMYAMAEAALQGCSEITEIHLTMPNKHHIPFDLSRIGMENRNEVFVPTDEPYGLIEATVRRS
jgi:urate oxidase